MLNILEPNVLINKEKSTVPLSRKNQHKAPQL